MLGDVADQDKATKPRGRIEGMARYLGGVAQFPFATGKQKNMVLIVDITQKKKCRLFVRDTMFKWVKAVYN